MSLEHIIDNKINHKPILFNSEMVKAIITKTKTQTRRMTGLEKINQNPSQWVLNEDPLIKGKWVFVNTETGEQAWIKSPYGQPNDLLWVKEKYRIVGWPFDDSGEAFTLEYSDGHIETMVEPCQYMDEEADLVEKLCDKMDKRCEPTVNEEEETFSWTGDQIREHMPWSPSIYMSKGSARFWLRIKNVRAERVQDISEVDAIAEGISESRPLKMGWKNYMNPALYFDKKKKYDSLSGAQMSFWSLWHAINGEGSFEANPWVWRIEFEVLSDTGAPSLLLLHGLNLIPS